MGSFLLKSKHVVLPDTVLEGVVEIDGEKIAAVYPDGDPLPDQPVIELGDKWLMPGLVDSHVHINEPGRTEWEGFATATAAAAAGGITTLIDMPLNSSPVTTTADALRRKIAAAQGQLAVDCGFHAGLIPGHVADLRELIDLGVNGVKAFLVYSGIPDFPAATQRELYDAMPLLAERRIPLLVHAELEGPAEVPPGNNASYWRYLASRPSAWEVDAIGMMIAACRETGCPVHIVHLATADALPLIESARAEGLPVTVETCPHYLRFQAEDIPDGDTRFKCAPPIREQSHREALWGALGRGLVDMIVSDHSPCPPDMKDLSSGDFFKAWGGISSLQLGLPVIHDECHRRGIPLEYISRWMSAEPAKLAGLYPDKGLILPGADADLVVFDPSAVFTVEAGTLLHRHPVTPYDKQTLYGVVERTYLRGQAVYDRRSGVVDRRGHVVTRR